MTTRRTVAAAVAATALFAGAPTAAHAARTSPDRSAGQAEKRRSRPQPRPVSPQLAAIAACESGGNPAAVDASGTYRGKYQFDQQTWESIGGTGDPAAAPEAVQDELAARLMAQRGSAPWPVCG